MFEQVNQALAAAHKRLIGLPITQVRVATDRELKEGGLEELVGGPPVTVICCGEAGGIFILSDAEGNGPGATLPFARETAYPVWKRPSMDVGRGPFGEGDTALVFTKSDIPAALFDSFISGNVVSFGGFSYQRQKK